MSVCISLSLYWAPSSRCPAICHLLSLLPCARSPLLSLLSIFFSSFSQIHPQSASFFRDSAGTRQSSCRRSLGSITQSTLKPLHARECVDKFSFSYWKCVASNTPTAGKIINILGIIWSVLCRLFTLSVAICLSVCLSVLLSLYLSVCSECLHVCLYVCLLLS